MKGEKMKKIIKKIKLIVLLKFKKNDIIKDKYIY